MVKIGLVLKLLCPGCFKHAPYTHTGTSLAAYGQEGAMSAPGTIPEVLHFMVTWINAIPVTHSR